MGRNGIINFLTFLCVSAVLEWNVVKVAAFSLGFHLTKTWAQKRASIRPSIGSRRVRFPQLLAEGTGVQDETGLDSVASSVAPFKGCQIEQVPGSLTTFTIRVDGEEADLGSFSAAIYKKIIQDAKQERFQGFRPGTIPPHLEPTYRAFSMDECAREATLEAMEQNSIRPFENARKDFIFEEISIPPTQKKAKGKKKKKSGRKGRKSGDASAPNSEIPTDGQVEEETQQAPPAWLTFDTMKGAIDAGWKPGQNFSFVVKDARGQQLKDGSNLSGIGAKGGLGGQMGVPDLNQMAAAVARDEAEKKQ